MGHENDVNVQKTCTYVKYIHGDVTTRESDVLMVEITKTTNIFSI